MAWFQAHSPALGGHVDEQQLSVVDECYVRLSESSERHASREKFLTELKGLKSKLVQLRSSALGRPPNRESEAPPDFAPLIGDAVMQKILTDRWIECVNCLNAPAPLAATVMMGGLLEGLLLARVNQESNKKPIFTATAAPKDKNGGTKPLKDWVLFDFISVAHELSWITVSAKSIGHALRDYRNYIHPQKQLTEGVTLGTEDAALWWEVSKGITRQLLK